MKRVFFAGVVFSLFIGGCKNNNAPGKIRVENKLNKKIVCVLGYNYPDTKLDFANPKVVLADSNLFKIEANEIKELDTLGLCKKDTWDKYIKRDLIELFVFDEKKLAHAKTLDDALIERYYFSYTQVIKDSGVIVVY